MNINCCLRLALITPPPAIMPGSLFPLRGIGTWLSLKQGTFEMKIEIKLVEEIGF